MKTSLLAVAVIFEIAVFCSGAEIVHLQDEQQQDSSISKRSLKSGVSEINLSFQHGMRDFIVNGKTGKIGQGIPAFFTTLTSGSIGPNYAHDAIKFNDVSLNIGNGYNPSTGKFTAPVDGIYQISFSYLQKNGYASTVQLIKDGQVYTEVHASHKNYDQLSKTVLIQLKKSQTVWVRLSKSSGYAVYGRERYTTFAGYLISH
ncbi:complement C1q-like protein 2 [Dendronephthya gigantea]|uniref:complement C1q-like protein 2 n=1 Tax=Dendronephthya gigantea TaxID=151771 RepID=UPI00106ADB6B|nr:complement C1q-like protein 2 [Dendronephthya gigantea]